MLHQHNLCVDGTLRQSVFLSLIRGSLIGAGVVEGERIATALRASQ